MAIPPTEDNHVLRLSDISKVSGNRAQRFEWRPDPHIMDIFSASQNEPYNLTANEPWSLTETTRAACSIYHNGWIYIIGDANLNPATFWRWNTESFVVERLADCHAPMVNTRMAILENKIYCLGTTTAPQNRFWVYDISSDTWEALAPHPLANASGSAMGFINGVLYVVGTVTTPQETRAYDPQTNTWSANLVNYGIALANNGSGVAYNGELYVFVAQTANHTRAYNPATNTWRILTNSPATNIAGRAVLCGDIVWIRGATTNFRSYHIPSNAWTARTAVTNSIVHGWLVSDGEQFLYEINGTLTGRNRITRMDTNAVRAGVWPFMPTRWATLGTAPAVVFDGVRREFYYASHNAEAGQVSVYSLDNNTWRRGSQWLGTENFQEASSFFWDGECYFLGGSGVGELGLMFRKWNPSTLKWTRLPDLPWAMRRTAIVFVSEYEFIAIGGASTSNRMSSCNLNTGEWTHLPDVPIAGTNIVAQMVDGKLHAILSNQAWCFDDGQWMLSSRMPFLSQEARQLNLAARNITGNISGNASGTLPASGGTLTLSQTMSGTRTLAANNTSYIADFPIAISTLTAAMNSVYHDSMIIMCSGGTSNRLLMYDPEEKTHIRSEPLPVSMSNGYVFIIDGNVYVVSPSGGVGNIYRLVQGIMEKAENGKMYNWVAYVIAGQSIFYERRNPRLSLTLNGEEVQPGETVADSTGFLKAECSTFERKGFLQGWIV